MQSNEEEMEGKKKMSVADHIFINMCKDILENGTSTEGEKVRPHWPDGTPGLYHQKIRCGEQI